MEKICLDCDVSFDASGVRCPECKRLRKNEKARIAAINRKHQNRVRLWNYLKEHPCVDCGEADFLILQFDHKDRTLKVLDIKDSLDFSWAKLEKEINKCEVRCPNCHARRTKVQMNHWYPEYNVAIVDPFGIWDTDISKLPDDYVLILKN